jgi:nucleoside-diphosphate-sugar epimerase
MSVFLTGATGYIGFAVAQAYRRAGHEVYGLCRSDDGARRLAAAEIHPVRGRLQDPETFRGAAARASLLIHAALDYQASDVFGLDRLGVEALLATGGSDAGPKTLIYTSGVWVYGNTGGRALDETAALQPPVPGRARPAIEQRVLDDTRVGGVVLRPGCLYGRQGGLTASWFAEPAAGRPATIVGDGSNRWAMVHLDDLAEGYLRAGESGVRGEIFNLTDGMRNNVGEMARAAAQAVGFAGGIRLVPLEEALVALGPVAEGLSFDQQVDSSKAARLLGWQPRHGGFLDGVETYCAAWRAASGAA